MEDVTKNRPASIHKKPGHFLDNKSVCEETGLKGYTAQKRKQYSVRYMFNETSELGIYFPDDYHLCEMDFSSTMVSDPDEKVTE